MEQQTDAMAMLDLLVRPGFCVKNGIIVRVNRAAEGRMIAPGDKIDALLSTGQEEYQDLNEGCLYLTLNFSGEEWGASVTRMGDFDVFLLDQDANQAELRAMALAAQDLRKPLSSVMTAANRLFPIIEDQNDPTAREQVARLNRGLYQLLRIVGNMSDATRYRTSTVPRQEIRDITAILADIFEQAATKSQTAGIAVQFSNLREPVYCLVDTEKLERALYNILSNALKYTPKGGFINGKLVKRGTKLYLTVQDSGCGIPDKACGNVYACFLREPGIEDSRQGIGLGMVLIRAAAAAHGGTVLIEQPKDQGARITMTMEIRQNAASSLRSPTLMVDYAGEWDHSLIELSDVLPAELYESK